MMRFSSSFTFGRLLGTGSSLLLTAYNLFISCPLRTILLRILFNTMIREGSHGQSKDILRMLINNIRQNCDSSITDNTDYCPMIPSATFTFPNEDKEMNMKMNYVCLHMIYGSWINYPKNCHFILYRQ